MVLFQINEFMLSAAAHDAREANFGFACFTEAVDHVLIFYCCIFMSPAVIIISTSILSLIITVDLFIGGVLADHWELMTLYIDQLFIARTHLRFLCHITIVGRLLQTLNSWIIKRSS